MLPVLFLHGIFTYFAVTVQEALGDTLLKVGTTGSDVVQLKLNLVFHKQVKLVANV